VNPTGRVFIIGAGPGDPGLISARGLKLLADADVVVYDRAVEALLRWARPDAERIAAGAPAEREVAQDAISMLLAEKARDGHTVARLKWGDAFVFDSGAKEALFLHEQGVPFEVVPGIPAAIGATAYAGVPVTYPGAGDALVLLRGQEAEGDSAPDVDWSAIAKLDGTLVCYAGARMVPSILQSLVDNGAPIETSAALIYRGTLPAQRTVSGTIEELLQASSANTAGEPAILVVGEVIVLRDHLRWFDERPLFGRRIVVTRSREQARDLVEGLENLGAQAIEAPTFRPRIRSRSTARRRRSTATTGSSSNRRTRSRGFSRRCGAGRAICARSAGSPSARSARPRRSGSPPTESARTSPCRSSASRASARHSAARARWPISACSSSGPITFGTCSPTI
jgi:uroporphyrinogen III methyltransferase/synthase